MATRIRDQRDTPSKSASTWPFKQPTGRQCQTRHTSEHHHGHKQHHFHDFSIITSDKYMDEKYTEIMLKKLADYYKNARQTNKPGLENRFNNNTLWTTCLQRDDSRALLSTLILQLQYNDPHTQRQRSTSSYYRFLLSTRIIGYNSDYGFRYKTDSMCKLNYYLFGDIHDNINISVYGHRRPLHATLRQHVKIRSTLERQSAITWPAGSNEKRPSDMRDPDQ
eukprot:3264733-Amphidinium_carterae.3